MGYKVGTEIADAPLSIEQKMSWHLTGNHYPPVNEAFIPVAVEAVRLANTNSWDSVLTYPNGVQRTVSYTVEGLHLEPFINTIVTPEEEE